MIICVCANVSDKQVKSVLNETCSLKAVRDQTGACKDCGICKKEIMKLVTQEKDAASASNCGCTLPQLVT